MKLYKLCLTGLAAVLLSGCFADGIENQQLADQSATGNLDTYTGPAPANLDVQNFKLAFYDQLKGDNRCGGCHTSGGNGKTFFVDESDVNFAYSEAKKVVNLSKPELSTVVERMNNGHNCWAQSSTNICVSLMTGFIEAWGGVEGGGGSTEVVLEAPKTERVPGNTLSFPETSALFGTTVYPLLSANCAECHQANSALAQQPYFASPDVDEAYAAAKIKISLDTPELSRFVARLNERHNCETNGTTCTFKADAMLSAIQDLATGSTSNSIDPTLVISRSMILGQDGIIAAQGGRHEEHVIAQWEFKNGEGNTAYDTAILPGNTDAAVNLTWNESDDINWLASWGLQIKSGTVRATNSQKLFNKIKETGEYSIEAWIAPSNVVQEGPARIISYSGGGMSRNVTLGQSQYNYDFMARTSNNDENGEPFLSTADADEVLQASLQHVVATFDPVNGRRLYVNGKDTGIRDDADNQGGTLGSWDNTFALVIGGEPSGQYPWAGSIRYMAFHNRVMNEQAITDNFEVGVGERFFLLFGVGHLFSPAIEKTYVVFEVSQYDNYSYLFSEPFMVNLDSTALPADFNIQGLNLGINGKEVSVGQAFAKLNLTLPGDQIAGARIPLGQVGTIIPVEKGSSDDEFFLSFDKFGTNDYVRVIAEPIDPGTPADLPAVSDIGLRDFAEINAEMANLTGVNTQTVKSTYDQVRQQLPTVTDINTFLSSQQMAVTQMAIAYCNALVEDTSLRAPYFNNFNFTAPVASAFDPAARNTLIDALSSNMLSVDLTDPLTPVELLSEPLRLDLQTELNGLIDKIAVCPADDTCSNGSRTQIVVKATCAAVLGSAVTLLQ